MQLSDPVTKLPLISASREQKLGRLGIYTLRDLLTHFPRYHKDTSLITQITDMNTEGEYTLQVTVSEATSIRIKGNRTLQKALLTDESGNTTAMWFNQPFIIKSIKPETTYLCAGKMKRKGSQGIFYPQTLEEINPGGEQLHLGRISPQYALTAGIGIKWLRGRIKQLLTQLDNFEDFQDEIASLVQGTSLKEAVYQIHFPASEEQLKESVSRLGLAELTNIQLLLKQERDNQQEIPAPKILSNPKNIANFISQLRFQLTSDQETSYQEILSDIENTQPMNRLLQGDVGSGKTLVAVIAALACAQAGYQVAVLCPTTILARQHLLTFQQLMPASISVQLVTSSVKTDSKSDILIGTSAVLARKQKLISQLGLVIVDEQHRFGVAQRQELLQQLGATGPLRPHMLNMTATPIPRTLALALFGDLKLSIINTKPPGRLPVFTKLVPHPKRQDALDWVWSQLKAGRQAYWMCPLVNESDNLQAQNATGTYDILSKAFPDLKIGLLHGKLSPTDKEAELTKFRDQQTNLLVCTSVIEVGIDVPNATIMVVENPERFGLAQLHQIRGRVGRGNEQSWCFLLLPPEGDLVQAATNRLRHFASHNDGLEIAQFDLEQRGPGEVYGQRQSGIPDLKIASLTHLPTIVQSRDLADRLWAEGTRQISLFAREDQISIGTR